MNTLNPKGQRIGGCLGVGECCCDDNSCDGQEPAEFDDLPQSPWIGKYMRKMLRGAHLPPSKEAHYLQVICHRLDYVATRAEKNHGRFQNDFDREEAEALVWTIQVLLERLEDDFEKTPLDETPE